MLGQFVLPLLPLLEVELVEVALALEGLFVILRHGVVILLCGDEPLGELHLEFVVGFAVLLVYLDDELLAGFEFLLLELVFLRTFLVVGGAVWRVGAASGVVGGKLGGLLIDEFAVKVLDLVVPLDKAVELIDLLGGFVQLGLCGIEGDSVFRAFCELLRTQSISFVYDYSRISGCLLLHRCILSLFQFTVNGSDIILLSVDCHLLLNSCLLQFHQLIVGGFCECLVLQRANVV